MAYQITYETADGSVEAFMNETSESRAERVARNGAKNATFNEALEITRWFVERDDATLATFAVA